MKKIFLIFAAAVLVFGYEAKIIPFDTYKIKSDAAGKVVKVNKNLEAENVKNALIVKIDDKQNLIDLHNLNLQAEILKKEIINQKEIVKKKKSVYEKYKKLTSKSQTEKDMKFYDYASSLNQLLNLQSQYDNTVANIDKIKDIISKKNIKADGYVYKIYVNKGDYAAPGMLIADVYDLSKQKLIIYVPIDEINSIKNKKVYINGKKSDFKIYKIWKTPDTQYVTSYEVELVGKGYKFGEIVNIKLK